MKRLLLPLLILAAAGATYYGLGKLKKKPKPQLPVPRIEQVETLAIHPRSHTIQLESQGTVVAAQAGILSMEVAGKILSTSPAFKVGGKFTTGDLLLTLDPTPYQTAQAQAKAQVAQAQLRLQEEEAKAEQALKEWEAAKSLTSEKPSDLVLRKPQLKQAEAGLDAAQASLQLAEHNLERTNLHAPYSGVVKEKLVEVGQVIGNATPVARIYGSDNLEIHLPLSALEVSFLNQEEDSKVTLSMEAGTGAWTWNATVDRNSDTIDPRTRLHRIIASIDASPSHPNRPELLPGQFMTATITGKTLDNIFRIPRRALLSDHSVYLVTPQDTLLRRDIHILHREQNHLIVDQGLQAGETLCLTRLQIMNDHMKVKRADNTPPTAQATSKLSQPAGQ